MFNPKRIRAFVTAAAVSLGVIAANPARASDPQADDSITLPPNINLFLYYNIIAGSGTVTTPNGTDLNHTRIATDINVFRYAHTIQIGDSVGGAEVVVPVVSFLGGQKIGGVSANHESGFGQPDFSIFYWPVNKPKTGTYVVLGAWIAPPVSSFSKIDSLAAPTLTPANNLLRETIEIGARKVVLGKPTTPNLALEGWYDGYFYQNNPNYASTFVPTPFGPVGPLDATYREQPTQEFRANLIYTFAPQVNGFGSIGFYQSLGGKQTLKIANVPQIVDTGLRTNESQLRFYLSSFVAPTVQTVLFSYIDVAAHGGPKQRIIGVRITKFF